MISLEGVTKSYLTLNGRKTVFRDLFLEIPDGKNVGLIGKNGAGKSTLMRLLSGVDLPDAGKILTRGRISWPVGLSAGFAKNLTARDNVKFVCRIYGIRREQMREKVKFVEEFAEIGDYFDEPISTYSSGMQARVAFGTSMAFDFDVYLIDEIMSVGDVEFRAKSRKVFDERMKDSKLVLVSHNMNIIRDICDIVVHLNDGRATIYEDVSKGIAAYRKSRD